MNNYRLSRIGGALIIALGIATPAMAADTTSASIRGNIVTSQGELASDATITVTDTRSGVSKTLQSNKKVKS